MVEVSCVNTHGRHEKIRLKRLLEMTRLKLLPLKTDRLQWPADPTNTTHYIDPFVTKTDQKGCVCVLARVRMSVCVCVCVCV